jgi:hypothetical protein
MIFAAYVLDHTDVATFDDYISGVVVAIQYGTKVLTR